MRLVKNPAYLSCLITACLLLCGHGLHSQQQHSFGLKASGESRYDDVVFSFPTQLRVKPPSGSIRWSDISLRSGNVYVVNQYKYRLMVNPDAPSLPEGIVLTFEIATEGNISPVRSSTSLTYDPASGEDMEFQVDFSGEGNGTIILTLLSASRNGLSFDIDPSRKTARISYSFIYFYEAVQRISSQPASPNRAYVNQVSAFLDTWGRVSQYEVWENPEVFVAGLSQAKSKLERMVNNLEAESRTGPMSQRVEAAGQLYSLFHDVSGGHSDIQAWKRKSREVIQRLDDDLWGSADQRDLGFLDQYLRLMTSIPDYPSAHGSEASSAFNRLFDNSYAQAQQDGSRQAYCDWYNLVKSTLFVAENPNDQRVTTAIDRCKISPCEAACNRGDCATVLAECDPSSDCYISCQNKLNERQRRQQAMDKYTALEEAFAEVPRRINVIELHISTLREEFAVFLTEEQIARIDTIESMIQPCEVNLLSNAPTKIDESTFYFDLEVISGANIQALRLDNRDLPEPVVDTLPEGIRYSWQGIPVQLLWQVPDSLFRVTVTDGTAHEIVFRAASGDVSQPLPLDQAEFKSSATVSDGILALDIDNGSEPFTLEWHAVSGDQIIYMSVENRDQTIDLASLPKAYNGSYELVVTDRFGRRVPISEPVLIEQPFQLSLWHWLLLPLLLIAGFLLYRNLMVPDNSPTL